MLNLRRRRREPEPEPQPELRVVPEEEETEAEEEPQPEEAVVIPFPTSRIPDRVVEEERQRSYEEVAGALGFKPAELVRAQIIEFFQQQGIRLFDYGEVSAWMTKKRTDVGAKNWCWRPLREKDIITPFGWRLDKNDDDSFQDASYHHSRFECRPYGLLVPQHALEKVAIIEERFGEDVRFFVAHYDDPNDPDPFIMVRPTQCNEGPENYELVFDAWDEPGFGDES